MDKFLFIYASDLGQKSCVIPRICVVADCNSFHLLEERLGDHTGAAFLMIILPIAL